MQPRGFAVRPGRQTCTAGLDSLCDALVSVRECPVPRLGHPQCVAELRTISTTARRQQVRRYNKCTEWGRWVGKKITLGLLRALTS